MSGWGGTATGARRRGGPGGRRSGPGVATGEPWPAAWPTAPGEPGADHHAFGRGRVLRAATWWDAPDSRGDRSAPVDRTGVLPADRQGWLWLRTAGTGVGAREEPPTQAA